MTSNFRNARTNWKPQHACDLLHDQLHLRLRFFPEGHISRSHHQLLVEISRQLTADRVNFSAASQEPFKSISVSNRSGLSLFLRCVMTRPLYENTRSEGPDDAGMARMFRATCAMSGYLCAFRAHHLSGSTTQLSCMVDTEVGGSVSYTHLTLPTIYSV